MAGGCYLIRLLAANQVNAFKSVMLDLVSGTIHLSPVEYTILIDKAGKAGHTNLAKDIFERMKGKNVLLCWLSFFFFFSRSRILKKRRSRIQIIFPWC
jgi:pentatricopeptide repeat protein